MSEAKQVIDAHNSSQAALADGALHSQYLVQFSGCPSLVVGLKCLVKLVISFDDFFVNAAAKDQSPPVEIVGGDEQAWNRDVIQRSGLVLVAFSGGDC